MNPTICICRNDSVLAGATTDPLWEPPAAAAKLTRGPANGRSRLAKSRSGDVGRCRLTCVVRSRHQ